ncbi:MAG TPA: DUF4198 domain-containing protein [Anaeromyxobacteraceae bacterium]|nr:DUF4198 domain-containing protein [Anaeromyxobacteraceae bacterium]
MPVRLPTALLAFAAIAVPGAAIAHDLWLEADGGALVLRSGHRGAAPMPIDGSRVTSIRCLRGAPPAAEVRPTATTSATELRVPGRCDVASALLDGGYWSLTPDGERNLPRTQVRDAVRSWQSRQLAKWVDAGSPAASALLGDELEIAPVGNLSRIRQGDKATFRVLFRGRPVAGAVLAIDHRPLGETDAAGECRIRIRAADVESVTATLKMPLDAPEAETLVLEASLTFAVAR